MNEKVVTVEDVIEVLKEKGYDPRIQDGSITIRTPYDVSTLQLPGENWGYRYSIIPDDMNNQDVDELYLWAQRAPKNDDPMLISKTLNQYRD